MKKLIFLTFIFIYNISFAQITESSRSMSQGANNALSIDLPGAKKKDIEKDWKKFIKDFDGKTKKVKKSSELFTNNALIPEMGNNTVDIYSLIEQYNEGVTLTVWFDLGGAYLSSAEHHEQYTSAEKIIYRFALKFSKEQIQAELKAQEKQLKKLEGDLKKLKKNNEDSHKAIESYKVKIAAAENSIVKNEADQVTKNEELAAQLKLIEEVKQRLKDIE